jgi:hypothetical protein
MSQQQSIPVFLALQIICITSYYEQTCLFYGDFVHNFGIETVAQKFQEVSTKQSSSGTHVLTYIKTLQNGTIDVCVHIANSLGFRVLVTLLDLGFSGLGFRVLV